MDNGHAYLRSVPYLNTFSGVRRVGPAGIYGHGLPVIVVPFVKEFISFEDLALMLPG